MPHNDKEDLLTKILIVELLLEELIKHEQVFYFFSDYDVHFRLCNYRND